MLKKRLMNLSIFIIAILVSGYVVYDYILKESSRNDQRIEEYLSTGGIENRDEEVSYSESEEIGPYPGRIAPNFTLPSWDESSEISLHDYRGNFVIMNAWASWCGPCKDEIPYLIDFHENYAEEDVEVLGVNLTNTETSKSSAIAFINDFNIPYDIAMDVEGFVEKEYLIVSLPMTFVIDPDGRTIIRKVGYMNYEQIIALYEEAQEIYYNEGDSKG
ncbi:TlpA family protein disulfide reductase [Evansella cellulosilytica]|uniref:Alkyl hydroperoxide reductase/ Thiol specific antioxidant/ Mal allergen n=1 Tax=Evansella cellulosilytica (strain ATCC 21833 / DSM 2522 / FERM P-1141 / JCM 9156 / N-4) TaxID=649639 RepID=E6TU93_EVAC2|nr:TlpA disulfide reductase family protein [Evansella cellulosilytica]ADU28553.1 alkyl hydroperoxide reductase/ Thiol specific antioxidant/ Mal allergen [Evansella cellulosilytica DSM 2522]